MPKAESKPCFRRFLITDVAATNPGEMMPAVMKTNVGRELIRDEQSQNMCPNLSDDADQPS